MQRIALFLALVLLSAWPAAIALGQPPIPYGTQLPPDAIGAPAEFQATDYLAKPYKREPLSSDPARRLEQIKQQKEQFTRQKDQKIAPLKFKFHKDMNDVAKVHVDKYLKQKLAERYPEQSFPRDYRELYASDVADLPGDPNYYTMRVDYVVELKNSPVGAPANVWHRCFKLDGNLKVVGSTPAALEEQQVRKVVGTSGSTVRPTREQLKKEAAELKEMKRKPAKPDKEKTDQ